MIHAQGTEGIKSLADENLADRQSRFRLSGKSSMSGRACRERTSVSNEETPSVPPLILMHSAVFSAVLYSRRRRRGRRVQQYRPRVPVNDTTHNVRVSLYHSDATRADRSRPERGRNGAEFCLPELNIHAGQ